MEYQPKRKTTKITSHKNKSSLKNIEENQNIIIKEADMKSVVVILDKTYYKTKI